jgi:hypothetical protein
LIAALSALAVWAVPGTAAAAKPTVTPLFDCYARNSDGSMTVILGYRSTYPNQASIPHGNQNSTNPSSYQTQMPTTFEAGTHHGVVSVRVTQADLAANPYWYLDGTTLYYQAAASASGICSRSQLPALANGAAVVVCLLVAGAVGALVVRRVRRTAMSTSAEERTREIAGGIHHA